VPLHIFRHPLDGNSTFSDTLQSVIIAPVRRILDIDLPPHQSAFIWGPRKVGKTTLLRQQFPHAPFFDLLDSDIRQALTRRPAVLREWIAAAHRKYPGTPVILDEVQKVPDLLDEVHWLIENRRVGFILCGSSARKIRRGQANLLGGRAWRYELFPLVSAEVPDLELDRALRVGLIPAHYLAQKGGLRSLEAYVRDYLDQEVAAEGHARNLRAFARFLELAGITNGQLVNFTSIASDVGVDVKTIQAYFDILQDTLLGHRLEPLPAKPGSRKNLVAAPKFYFCDPGIARELRGSNFREARHADGHLFETLIANELFAYLSYRRLRTPIHFYRTHAGAEVDFVIDNGGIAIEATLQGNNIRAQDLRGMNDFLQRYPKARAIVVSLSTRARCIERDGRPIDILPWRDFCQQLWAGEIIPAPAQPAKAKASTKASTRALKKAASRRR